jgi:hypothetical protein
VLCFAVGSVRQALFRAGSGELEAVAAGSSRQS